MCETHRAVDVVQRRFRMSQEMYSDNRTQAAFLVRTKSRRPPGPTVVEFWGEASK